MPINLGLVHKRLAAIAPNLTGVSLNDDATLTSAELHFEPGTPQAEIDAANAWLSTASDVENSAPTQISKYQFKVQLHRSGQLETIKTALQDAGVDEEVRLYWSDTQSIAVDSPLVQVIQSTLGYTDLQIANFFQTASEI